MCDSKASDQPAHTRSLIRAFASRTKSQLTMMFKILHGLVDIPADDYLTPASTRTGALHTKKQRQYASSTDALKYRFFPRTITTWNSLSASIADAPDLVSFKRELSKSSF